MREQTHPGAARVPSLRFDPSPTNSAHQRPPAVAVGLASPPRLRGELIFKEAYMRSATNRLQLEKTYFQLISWADTQERSRRSLAHRDFQEPCTANDHEGLIVRSFCVRSANPSNGSPSDTYFDRLDRIAWAG